jgi:tetratricopeptide (TPR) repeat protein
MRSSYIFPFMVIIHFLAGEVAGQSFLADSLRRGLKEDTLNVNLLIQLTKEIRKQGKIPEAEKYATRALLLARSSGRYSIIDSALLENAALAYALGDLEKATGLLNERISREAKENDSSGLAKSYSYLGGYLSEKGKKVEALGYHLQAKAIADRLSDPDLSYIVYASLGEYYHQSDYERALEYRLKALEYSKQIKSKIQSETRTAEISANIGLNYVLKGDYTTAKKYLDQVMHYSGFPGISLGDHLALAFATYGYIYALHEDYDSAAYYYHKAIDFRKSRGETSRLHDSYGLLGQVYMEQGKKKESLKYLNLAVNMAKENRALHFQYKWSPVLANAYSEAGQFESAFNVMNEFYLITDSVMSQTKAKALAGLEAKYQLKEKEYENQMLKKEGDLQIEINQKQKVVFGGALVLVFIGGLAFYFRAEVNRHKNILLKERVDAQNRELATVALLVSKKNQAFSGVKSKLQEMSRENDALSESFRPVLKEIDHEIDFDEEWNIFKYHFEKVHPSFFIRLKELAPGLSVNELRLCAYLRTNLSTKEIARLSNTTNRAVQQAKYRLNQKFQPHNEPNLSDFLSGL